MQRTSIDDSSPLCHAWELLHFVISQATNVLHVAADRPITVDRLAESLSALERAWKLATDGHRARTMTEREADGVRVAVLGMLMLVVVRGLRSLDPQQFAEGAPVLARALALDAEWARVPLAISQDPLFRRCELAASSGVGLEAITDAPWGDA